MKQNHQKPEALSLLDMARLKRTKEPRMLVTKEHYDLAVAWAKEEISLSQVEAALELKSGGARALTAIATIFKESYWNGYLKL